MNRAFPASPERAGRYAAFLIAFFSVLLLCARSVSAEPLPRIAIVRVADADPREGQRLRAELESLGFEVVEVSGPGDPLDPEALEQTARGLDAIAAVQLSASEGKVEIWILDRVTGKTVRREFSVPPHESPDELVALRAVELLRASLIELGLPAAPPGEVAPPPAVTRMLPAPRPFGPPAVSREVLSLGVGPAAAFSPGGVPPSIEVGLFARLPLTAHLGGHALFLFPTLPVSVDGKEGSADLSLALFAAGLDLSVLPLDSRFRLRTGASGGIVYLRAVGAARPPFASDTRARAVGAVLGRVELLAGLSQTFWLGAELCAGFTPSRMLVSFADREVAHWGQPFGAAGLVLEVAVR